MKFDPNLGRKYIKVWASPPVTELKWSVAMSHFTHTHKVGNSPATLCQRQNNPTFSQNVFSLTPLESKGEKKKVPGTVALWLSDDKPDG